MSIFALFPRRRAACPGARAHVVMSALLAAAVVPAAAQDEAKPPQAATPAAPATVTAEKGRFEVVLEAKGDFEPVDPVVVQFKPEQWAQALEIVNVVRHGTIVKAGDVLVEFDTEKFDRAIADLEVDLAIGERAIEIARRELPVTEALVPLELAASEREARAAGEDLARFLATGRTLAEDSARFRLRSAEESLKYNREELRQLEKMYRDKDLTEETEEMILQRTRFEVESAEFNLRRAGVDTEAALELEIPRREAALRDAAEKTRLGLEKERATSGLALEQKRLGLQKAERDRAEALRKMRDLEADRAAVPLKAPRDGVAYLGRLHDGAWSTGVVAAKAAPGQSVLPGEMVFTIVDPARVAFRIRIDEKETHLVTPALGGRVELTGRPDAEVAIAIEPAAALAPVPRDGKLDVRFAVTVPEGAPRPLPGTTGAATCRVYEKADAVTLPATAVSRAADGTREVWLPGKDGAAPQRRAVRVGRSSGGRVEILEGVAAGDVVLAAKP
ncbi:MAG: HlyD family efflux transporter periplasmic adaptor subunit [Planctomycetaceae bacterium]